MTRSNTSAAVAAALAKLTTISFHVKPDMVVEEVHLNAGGDTVFVGSHRCYTSYELSEVKSIIPPKQGPHTKLQRQFMNRLMIDHSYKWDKQHSVAAAGVVLKRPDGDFWFFGMEGEIMHNPDGIKIPITKTGLKPYQEDIF